MFPHKCLSPPLKTYYLAIYYKWRWLKFKRSCSCEVKTWLKSSIYITMCCTNCLDNSSNLWPLLTSVGLRYELQTSTKYNDKGLVALLNTQCYVFGLRAIWCWNYNVICNEAINYCSTSLSFSLLTTNHTHLVLLQTVPLTHEGICLFGWLFILFHFVHLDIYFCRYINKLFNLFCSSCTIWCRGQMWRPQATFSVGAFKCPLTLWISVTWYSYLYSVQFISIEFDSVLFIEHLIITTVAFVR